MHWLTLNGRLPWTFLPLVLILLVGLGLRLYGTDWDSGFGFHPDERDIYMRSGCMYDLLTEAPGYQDCGYVRDQPDAEPGLSGLGTFLDPDRSPLNPHWFPLGSILIYVLVFFRSIIEMFTDINALDMRFTGRTLSALADVGSIFLVYVLGRRMFGSGVGLLAAAFTALAVIHIQNSHFYRPETFSVLFTLASFWAMLRMVERKRLRDSALLGLMVGLALAPKVNVLPLVLPLALAYWYRVLDSVDGRWSEITPEVVHRVLGHAAVAVIVAVGVFLVSAPYALLDMGAFIKDLVAQSRMASNAGLLPFTVQYIDTPPFIYQFQQSSVWGLGLPLGVVAWLGVPFTTVMVLVRRETRRSDLLLLAWVVPSFLILESFEVRFLRYVFPLMPFLILMGSRMLLCLVQWARPVPVALTQPMPEASYSGEISRIAHRAGGEVPQSATLEIEGPDQQETQPSPTLRDESYDEEEIPSNPPFRKGGVGDFGSRTDLLWKGFKERLDSLWRSRSGLPRTLLFSGPISRLNLTWLAVGLVVAVLGATAFYALAFERVYARDHPAVTASQWINDNVPVRTAIVSDNHWDEFVPDLYRYRLWQFPVYDADTPEKMDNLASQLFASEYLLFYSNRPYGSVARVPERYPLSASYYQRLFAGELGYRLDRTFTSYPQLAGVAFRDDPFGRAGLSKPVPMVPEKPAPISLNLGYADDNVVGYDHPQVMLFRNVGHLSQDELRSLLASPQVQNTDPPRLGLMLSEEQLIIQQTGGTWSSIIDRDSWTNDLPIVAWLLVVELAFLVSLPLSMFIFRPLPDRGIILARILGLLGVSYVAWLGVSLGWFDFSRTAVIVGFLIMGSLSALVLLARWREMKGFLEQNWRLLLLVEVLFLTAFLAFVALRSAIPDLWHPHFGGEKPMELAYFNAVIRSTTLPPFDPWFAGGYLNYYYWGYFVLAGIVHITGMLPTTAFNLAVPLFFALTVTGAFSLVYNMTAGVRRARVRETLGGSAGSILDSRPEPSRWRSILGSPVGAGLTAGLFIAVIGNLDGMFQIIQQTWHKLTDGGSFPAFFFWRSSRMLDTQENFDPSPLVFWVPDKVAGFADRSPHITEFPFFTFLYGDLHAHMMVLPFTLLVIGLGLCLVVGLRSNSNLWALVTAAALAVALGSLWVINSADYPSYLLLTLALLALAFYFRAGRPFSRLLMFVGLASGVTVVSILAFLPFHDYNQAFATSLEASKWRTPLDRLLGIHGLFLFVIATFLVYRARGTLMVVARSLVPSRNPSSGNFSASQTMVPSLIWLRWVLGLGLLLTVLLAIAGYWTVVVLLVLLMLTGVSVWDTLGSRSEERAFASVPLVLLALGLAIAIGVDFVRTEGDIGRMNTMFKYYMEVWVLLSLAAAYMLWQLFERGLFRPRWTWLKTVWLGAVVLLIGSSLVYTALGTRNRIDFRFNPTPATLDGTAYMETAVHTALGYDQSAPFQLKWDRDAIRWLQDNVSGSPVILEAHNDTPVWQQYSWSTRIADYTGLPTVLGWPGHQRQQRGDYQYAIFERMDRVREIYDTTDVGRAQELLQQYRVKYVMVGELERRYYALEGLQKFEDLATEGWMQRVYENQGMSIYEIN